MNDVQERTATLDGTLRAVVAADRFALSDAAEEVQLLHRRLTVIYGYFALLGSLGAIAGRARRVLVDIDPRALAFVVNARAVHARGGSAQSPGPPAPGPSSTDAPRPRHTRDRLDLGHPLRSSFLRRRAP